MVTRRWLGILIFASFLLLLGAGGMLGAQGLDSSAADPVALTPVPTIVTL